MHTGQSIAKALGIANQRFTRIANRLRGAGIIVSASGRHGGYMLGRPAKEISIYDVFVSMQGDLYISKCVESADKCENRHCEMHAFLQTLQDNLIERMAGKSIVDLA